MFFWTHVSLCIFIHVHAFVFVLFLVIRLLIFRQFGEGLVAGYELLFGLDEVLAGKVFPTNSKEVFFGFADIFKLSSFFDFSLAVDTCILHRNKTESPMQGDR